MILNFICTKIELSNDETQQRATFTKTDKKPGKTITPVVGKIEIRTTLEIVITDNDKFDTYKADTAYNLELFVQPKKDDK